MNIKKFKKDSLLPFKKHQSDVGLDFYTPEKVELLPLETKVVGLGWGIEVPSGYSAMLVPRSSAAKRGLIIQTSIIDPGYTGEIHLIVTNCSNHKITIEKEERVCSLVIYSVITPPLKEVENFKETKRGTGGLGSTGR